jgi:uncharacterized protein YndB with AHSA1/START domain
MARVARDTIEREILLRAPVDRVWASLTDPAHVSRWFGTEAEIDLRPGGPVLFGWPGEGRFHGTVVAVEPPRRFAYRWCLDRETPVDEGPSTLVDFTLDAVSDGTRLRLVESGFAALPDDIRDRHFSENSQGWLEELAQLATHVEAASVAD